MATLTEVKKEVDSLVDGLGAPVDEKIKPLVIALRFLDFETTASCAGHLNRGFPYPWVGIEYTSKQLNKAASKRLKKLLREFYKTRGSEHRLLLQKIGIYGAFRLQNVRWPQTRAGREKQVDIPDKKLLAEYQTEMNAFAEFLLSKK